MCYNNIMSKKVVSKPVEEQMVSGETRQDPNQLLQKLLKENNLKLDIQPTDTGVSFVGDGFVLTDKPLLKIRAFYGRND